MYGSWVQCYSQGVTVVALFARAGMSRLDHFWTTCVAIRLCHALLTVAIIARRAMLSGLAQLDTGHRTKNLPVFWASLRVEAVEQPQKQSSVSYLPFSYRLCSVILLDQVSVCDNVVGKVRNCESLALEQADFVQELADSVQADNVQNVLLLVQSLQSKFKLIVAIFPTTVTDALSHAPFKAA